MLIALSFAVTLLAECRMPYARATYPISSARGCIEAPLLTEEVFYQTQEALEAMLPMNVFVDICKKPPAPYEHLATDTEASLSLIREKYSKLIGKATAWEYHEALAKTFRDLKDAHSLYVKPSFFGHFRLAFPLAFNVSKTGSVTFTDLPTSVRYISESYTQMFSVNLADYIGAEILTINNEKPLLYLAKWADKYVYSTKSSHGRLNSLLSGDFYARSLKVFGLPEQGDENLVFTLVDGRSVILRFSIYSDTIFNSEDDAVRAYMRCISLSTPYTLSGGNNASEPTAFEKLQSEETAGYLVGVRDAILRATRGRGLSYPSDYKAYARFMDEEVSRSGIQYSKYSHTSLAHFSYNSSQRSESEYEYIKGDDMFSLYKYTSKSTISNQDNVYILAVYSFSPMDMATTINNIIDALEILRERLISQLMVVLNGNGGGIVTMGHLLGRALFPSNYPIYGAYNIRANRIMDALVKAKSWFTLMHRTDPWSGANMTIGDSATDTTDWYFKNQETYPEINDLVYNGRRTARFSQRFAFDDDLEPDLQQSLLRFYKFRGLDLSPDRVAIVTDGTCGSTCATFAKHLLEAKRCLAIGLGGTTGLSEYSDDPYDAASFSGGTVEDSQSLQFAVEELIMNPPKDGLDNMDVLTKLRIPTDAYARFAFHQLFSWDIKTHDWKSYTPLEYTPVPVHAVLPIYPTVENWQGLEGIDTFAEDVYVLMRSIEEASRTSNCTNVPTSLYHFSGNETASAGACPYLDDSTRGAFNCNNSCVFYDCKVGFYLDPLAYERTKLWECQMRTDVHAWDSYIPPPEDHSMHFAHYLLLLIFLCTIALFVFIIIASKRPDLIKKCIAKMTPKKKKMAANNIETEIGLLSHESSEIKSDTV
ncbi:Hypothetical protein DHA2_16507 [Giardia duodenalis]|uniref:Tail specific protease domain-containing protein n=1 Tax=Giardia intestinalis TaxID=5741 RepID=V6TJ45_GIAIN|nr:Hypothetical protein DHA2_16507 [Giardia intestinalis]